MCISRVFLYIIKMTKCENCIKKKLTMAEKLEEMFKEVLKQ